MKGLTALAAILLLALPVAAQTSASYSLEEHVFNAGGHPEGGTVMSSPSFRVSLDCIGEGITGRGLSSASYDLDGSFGFGQCEQLDLTAETATDVPPAAAGYFYVVTAENRVGEEGTKGWDTVGAERANASPCP